MKPLCGGGDSILLMSKSSSSFSGLPNVSNKRDYNKEREGQRIIDGTLWDILISVSYTHLVDKCSSES